MTRNDLKARLAARYSQEEWQPRQALYHSFMQIKDDLSGIQHVVKQEFDSAEIVLDVLNYLYKEVPIVSFPAKTYAVALIYAKLLETHFGVQFYEALSDSSMLYGNMRDYEPYPDKLGIYDAVLTVANLDDVLRAPPSQALATVGYFHDEFFIGSSLDEINTLLLEAL